MYLPPGAVARVKWARRGKPLGSRLSQGLWYIWAFICVQFLDPNVFPVQVFVALKSPTISINKAEGDHVHGGILSCLESWKGNRTEKEVKAMLQATWDAVRISPERGWRLMRAPARCKLGKPSVCLHPSLLAIWALSPLLLTSFTAEQAATRQLESLAGFRGSVPMPRLLMTSQTLMVLAHSNVALSSSFWLMPAPVSTFRSQVLRRILSSVRREARIQIPALDSFGPSASLVSSLNPSFLMHVWVLWVYRYEYYIHRALRSIPCWRVCIWNLLWAFSLEAAPPVRVSTWGAVPDCQRLSNPDPFLKNYSSWTLWHTAVTKVAGTTQQFPAHPAAQLPYCFPVSPALVSFHLERTSPPPHTRSES